MEQLEGHLPCVIQRVMTVVDICFVGLLLAVLFVFKIKLKMLLEESCVNVEEGAFLLSSLITNS